MRALWSLCKSLGFKYILTRRLNQDRLENFIGMMRDENGGNRTPTVQQFEAAFKSLLLRALEDHQTMGRNCEADDATFEPLHEFVMGELLQVSKTAIKK